jgi:hypothetical protein
VQFANQRRRLGASEDANPREAFHMHLARGDIVHEEFAIEHDIIGRKKRHDLRIDFDAGLLPQKVTHAECPPIRRNRTRD